MSHSNTHQFRLRIHQALKNTLEELAWANKHSTASEIIQRISGHHVSDINESCIPPKVLLVGDKVVFGFRIPTELLENIKRCASELGTGMTAEMLRRIYLTHPLADHEIIKAKERAAKRNIPMSEIAVYQKDSLNRGLTVNEKTSPKGLFTQSEDERILLEKYRAMSASQRTQLQAISNTFNEQQEKTKGVVDG